jgi:hypothetical protein
MMILQCYVTCATGETLLNELRSKRLFVKTIGSIRILGVMNQKPPEGTKINKSISQSADMCLMSWTANYTLV